jgi:hypothetical protein
MGLPGYSGEQGVDLSIIADRIAAPAEPGSSQYDLREILNEIKDAVNAAFQDELCSVFVTQEGEGENNVQRSVFHGLTALGERISTFERIVEELQSIMESKAVSIMHTSESDKVVFVTD